MHSSPALTMMDNGTKVINLAKEYDYKIIYLSEMIFLDDALPIKHRGRCHLLLVPSDYDNIELELQSIKQNTFPDNL